MAYAELAALRPRAGGEYVYLREAFGPLAAFLTGWTSFVAGFSGAIAASAVGLASYIGRFFPAAGDATPLVSIPLGFVTLSLSRQALVALVAIYALSWVHMRGLGPGRVVQNTLAVMKVVTLLAFVALGLTIGQGSWSNLSASAETRAGGLLLALIPVMFSYSGWNAAAYVAEEVRDPGRNVPRALALGTGAVIVVYLALNVVYLYAMPVTDLVGLRTRVIDAAGDRLFGAGVGNLLAVVTIFIIAGSISAMVLAGPRVYFAMARDGVFLRQARARPPEVRDAGVRHRRAGRLEHAARALRDVRPARRLHRLRGHPVRGGRGGGALRAALERAGRRTAIQGLRLSGGARDLRAHESGHRDQRDDLQSAAVARWYRGHRRGDTSLLLLQKSFGPVVDVTSRGSRVRAARGPCAHGRR